MKIAICLSGYPKFLRIGYNDSKAFYSGCDVDYFIHGWGDDNTLRDVREVFNPKKCVIEPQIDFSNYLGFEPNLSKTTKNAHDSVSPLYSIEQVGKLIEEDTINYDFVIFTRADVSVRGRKLNELIADNNVVYSSYCPGSQWLVETAPEPILDTKFICSSKKNMVYFSKMLTSLKTYLLDDGRPLCHHRISGHHMVKGCSRFQMIQPSPNETNGGWWFIRGENNYA